MFFLFFPRLFRRHRPPVLGQRFATLAADGSPLLATEAHFRAQAGYEKAKRYLFIFEEPDADLKKFRMALFVKELNAPIWVGQNPEVSRNDSSEWLSMRFAFQPIRFKCDMSVTKAFLVDHRGCLIRTSEYRESFMQDDRLGMADNLALDLTDMDNRAVKSA